MVEEEYEQEQQQRMRLWDTFPSFAREMFLYVSLCVSVCVWGSENSRREVHMTDLLFFAVISALSTG